MPRIDLKVPFAEKGEAKRLGACWDAARKVWFVPGDIPPEDFRRWLPIVPTIPDINVRSDNYFIAQSERECWKCGKNTRVYGFFLPAEYELLEPLEDMVAPEEGEAIGQEESLWCRSSEQTVLSYVTNLAPAVAARIEAFTPHYRMDFNRATRTSFRMNHCEHCGVIQGDHYLFEITGAFCPVDEQAASRIVLRTVSEPFSCHAGSWFLDVPLFHSMQCA